MSPKNSLWSRKRIWRIACTEEKRVQWLSERLQASPLLARVLCARGIDDYRHARRFLEATVSDQHDPYAMRDMDVAVERIALAIKRREPVLIHGDYDVDGISATALLISALTTLGGQVFWFLPHRLKDGYGVSLRAVEHAKRAGVKLIITADCGSTAVDAIRRARELGMDVVVVDHHEPKNEHPPASAILNPKREDCTYPFPELCGTGIAFKLTEALIERMGGPQELAESYLDLVALATVVDVAPLLGENRVLVRAGLEKINRRERLGLRVLSEVSGLLRKNLNTYHLSFVLGPPLNAAGRLEHAKQALQLLLSQDLRQAEEISRSLNALNRRRQQEEEKTLQRALEMIQEVVNFEEETVITLANRDWHPGVVGIVASRLVELFHRPTILIALEDGGLGRGSARSIPAFHIFEAMEHCSQHLLSCGGHRLACGLTIHESKVADLRRSINEVAAQCLKEEELLPKVNVDAIVSDSDLSFASVEKLSLMEPFGFGNPKPVFALLKTTLLYSGVRGSRGEHLFIRVRAGNHCFEFIGFGMGEAVNTLKEGMPIDLCFTAELGEYMGTTSLSLQLKDFRTPKSEVTIQPNDPFSS